jgi:hypothetical protein
VPQEQAGPADAFAPTRGRVLLVLLTAGAAFWVPQEIPLEFYPLNNPSGGMLYLEITCASAGRADVQVFVDRGKGWEERESIRWPLDRADMPYTYTFPLRDAPLMGLRLDPIDNGAGELLVTNLRIINRRGEEVRRFGAGEVEPVQAIASVQPSDGGWRIVTTAGAADPQLLLRLPTPIVPEGMNARNLQRSLLSWSYLAGMLWLLLAAVYFAFRGAASGGRMGPALAFLLLVALAFSAVGNRGLIWNSAAAARAAGVWAAGP